MVKRFKIIQITPYYPPHIGGMELRVRDLSERLAEKNHHVSVITSDQGSFAHVATQDNDLIITYLKSRIFLNTTIIPRLVTELFRIPKKSIVHVHISQAFVPEVTILICRLRGIPVIAHIRLDPKPSHFIGIFIQPLHQRLILKPSLHLATRVIVLTDDYVDLMARKYGLAKDRITVIPNATTFPISKRGSKKLHNPVRILLVGRLATQKNIPLLIAATKRLKQENIHLSVTIAGEGDKEATLKRIVKKDGLESDIKFVGRLDKSLLIKAYSNCDIVVQTSREEAFSSVLIETMAMAKPLIATNIEGTRSIIKDGYNGLLIDPKSIDNLVEAIKKLIDSQKLRDKLVQNGLKVIKKYTWDEVVKSTEKVYEEVKLKEAA